MRIYLEKEKFFFATHEQMSNMRRTHQKYDQRVGNEPHVPQFMGRCSIPVKEICTHFELKTHICVRMRTRISSEMKKNSSLSEFRQWHENCENCLFFFVRAQAFVAVFWSASYPGRENREIFDSAAGHRLDLKWTPLENLWAEQSDTFWIHSILKLHYSLPFIIRPSSNVS